MNYPAYGQVTRVTTTGTVAITSANAQLIGILCASSGTCSVQIFAGVTTSASVSPVLRFQVTVVQTIPAPQYLSYPANLSGGFTVKLGAAADPEITLFWNPTGGA